MISRRPLCLMVLVASFWFGGTGLAAAAERAVLILADGITPELILQTDRPQMAKLMREGGVGLVNTRTGRPQDLDAGYATLGAGARAVGSASAGLGSDVEEVVGSRTGMEAYRALLGQGGKPAIVNPYVYASKKANEAQDYHAAPGVLGTVLATGNKKVALYGNADGPDALHREAVLVAMDEQGEVPLGSVAGWASQPNPTMASGMATDYSMLWSKVDQALTQADLIVIETGDTARLSRVSTFLPREQLQHELDISLDRLDAFLGKVRSALDPERDLLLVVSPSPPSWRSEKSAELTPIIIWGSGIKESSLLISPSTRSRGLVANTDVAATLLHALGQQVPLKMSGRPITSIPAGNPIAYLLQKQGRMLAVEEVRKPVLTTFVFTVIALFLLGLLQIVFSLHRWLSMFLPYAFLWLLAAPISFLLASLLELEGIYAHIVATGTLAAAITVASVMFARGTPLIPLFALSALNVLALGFDLLFGLGLNSLSVLGHSGIIGARFYGLGNEYVGIILAASVVAIGSYAQLRGVSSLRLAASGVCLLIIALIIAHPQAGANVGGTIAVAVAFTYLILRLAAVPIGLRQLALVAGAALIAVGVLLFLDFLGPSRSHAGQALLNIQAGGWEEAVDIIKRKLAMNLRLIRFTVWSQVLIAGMIVFAVLLARPPAFLAGVKQAYLRLSSALGALILGTVVAFVVNDSGVVAAATSVTFGIASLLYLLVLAERPADGAKWVGP